MNSGIVEAWTGVMRFKPILVNASIIHSARGGLSVSQAREGECVESPPSGLGVDEGIAKMIVGFQKCMSTNERQPFWFCGSEIDRYRHVTSTSVSAECSFSSQREHRLFPDPYQLIFISHPSYARRYCCGTVRHNHRITCFG